ncbi:MAG: hypothetical protein ACOY94_09585 [Bacillota bacterium]
MRLRQILAGLFALLLFPLFAPTPASALSCIDPVSVLDSQQVVVQGTVTSRPVKDKITVTVDRYFRGTGPAVIQAEIQGIEPRNDQWMNNPQVGTSYILGFVTENGNLVHRPCDLFFDLSNWQPSAELKAKLGEGTKPLEGSGQPSTGGTGTGAAPGAPEATAAGGLPWRTILPVAGTALLVAAGVGLALRLRSRQ